MFQAGTASRLRWGNWAIIPQNARLARPQITTDGEIYDVQARAEVKRSLWISQDVIIVYFFICGTLPCNSQARLEIAATLLFAS